MVREICGLHAQVMSSAELSPLGARRRPGARGGARGAVGAALPGQDLGNARDAAPPAGGRASHVAAQGALRPRYETASWQRHFGLTREEAEAMFAAIADALDGRPLTREELAHEEERR